MKTIVIRRRLRQLERSLPQPAVEPLPPDVAAAAIDVGLAVAARTGERGGGRQPSVVDRAMLHVMTERLAGIERGDVGLWTKLFVDGELAGDGELSTDPAAVAELDRILAAIGFDEMGQARCPS